MKTYKELMEGATEFDTSLFVRSHGKNPSGKGSWAFSDKRNAKIDDVWFSPGTVSYVDAKKAAKSHFKNAPVIYVQP